MNRALPGSPRRLRFLEELAGAAILAGRNLRFFLVQNEAGGFGFGGRVTLAWTASIHIHEIHSASRMLKKILGEGS